MRAAAIEVGRTYKGKSGADRMITAAFIENGVWFVRYRSLVKHPVMSQRIQRKNFTAWALWDRDCPMTPPKQELRTEGKQEA